MNTKYTKSQKQKKALEKCISSPCCVQIRARNCFKDGSLLVEKTDEKGRVYYRGLTPGGAFFYTRLIF